MRGTERGAKGPTRRGSSISDLGAGARIGSAGECPRLGVAVEPRHFRPSPAKGIATLEFILLSSPKAGRVSWDLELLDDCCPVVRIVDARHIWYTPTGAKSLQDNGNVEAADSTLAVEGVKANLRAAGGLF